MVKRTPRPRVIEPSRSQGVIRFELPEESLPPEHPARVLDRVVGTMDLSAFTRGAKAVEGRAGRARSEHDAADPLYDE
jgi:hypothetical protein